MDLLLNNFFHQIHKYHPPNNYMLTGKEKTALHDLFLIGIVIKGIDGLLEMLGGIAFLFLSPSSIPNLLKALFQKELIQDPTDIVANFFIHIAQTLTSSSISFISLYLVLHGLIKVGLFAGLWLNKMWAYPVAGVVMSLFVLYQLAMLFNTHSIILLIFTLIDIVIISLLRLEYKRIKKMN